MTDTQKLDIILETLHTFNGKFDNIDQKFDAIDKKFDAIDKKFDAIEKKFDAIEKKFDAIEKKFDAIDKRFDAIDKRLDTHDNRFNMLERNLKNQIHTSESLLLDEIDRVHTILLKHIDNKNQHYYVMQH